MTEVRSWGYKFKVLVDHVMSIFFWESGLAVSSFLKNCPMAPTQQWGSDNRQTVIRYTYRTDLSVTLSIKLRSFLRATKIMFINVCKHYTLVSTVTTSFDTDSLVRERSLDKTLG